MESNDTQDKKEKESDDNSYWQSYFESEAHSMDVHREWGDMASNNGFRKKHETNQRLDKPKRKQKKTPDGFIFDR